MKVSENQDCFACYFLLILTTLCFVVGLLNGKVGISADARLKCSFGKEENVIQDDENSKETVIAKMKALIDLAADAEGFENMRKCPEHKEVFFTFVNICLVHFCSSMKWRYAAYNTLLSDIFTESDEAFAMLLLENNATDYKQMVLLDKKLTRKEARPKYTKDPNMTKKFKGWSKNGIKRYNNLVQVVKKNRKCSHSNAMEVELKKEYAKLCGKDGNLNEGGGLDDNEVSDDESLEAYDGFACDDTDTGVVSYAV